MKCKKCGSELKPGWKYCRRCGARVPEGKGSMGKAPAGKVPRSPRKTKVILLVAAATVAVAAIVTVVVWTTDLFHQSMPGNSYLKIFGTENMNKDTLEFAFKKNISVDIGEVVLQDDGNGAAKITVSIPDINKLYQEIVQRYKGNAFETTNIDTIVMSELKSGTNKYINTYDIEGTVSKVKGNWTIVDKNAIDTLIDEQINELVKNALSQVEFTPFDIEDMLQ